MKYWVWLSTRRGLAGVTMQRVLDHFGGPERVYYAHARDVDELTELSGLARSSLKDKSMREVERILDHCDQLGIRVMTRQDAVYPQRLENIPQPPLVLYAKGVPSLWTIRWPLPWWVPAAAPLTGSEWRGSWPWN